jgi:hypothetical protein
MIEGSRRPSTLAAGLSLWAQRADFGPIPGLFTAVCREHIGLFQSIADPLQSAIDRFD